MERLRHLPRGEDLEGEFKPREVAGLCIALHATCAALADLLCQRSRVVHRNNPRTSIHATSPAPKTENMPDTASALMELIFKGDTDNEQWHIAQSTTYLQL